MKIWCKIDLACACVFLIKIESISTLLVIQNCLEDPCKNGATCVNGTGGTPYNCTCANGWEGPNCDTSKIEIASGLKLYLASEFRNVNHLFSFYTDLDECTLQIDNCHDNSTCSDIDGSFMCTCNEGYTGDGLNCTGCVKLYIFFKLFKLKYRFRLNRTW